MNKNDIFRKTWWHLDIFYKSRYANNHDIKVLYIDGSKKLHHIVGLIKTFLFSLWLMASKIEKEVNFLISNYPWIIALLDKEMTFAWEQKILFSYYHNHSDPSIYWRIESYIEQGKITNKIITLKRNVTIEGWLKIRKEFSFSIDNDEDSSMFFDIIGLSYTNSKWKIRRIYKNTEWNVEFDVDSRYNQTFDQKTEDRIEIETDSDDSIAIYSSFIKNYVVNEN
jgi:adenylate cyclase class IV